MHNFVPLQRKIVFISRNFTG